MAEATKEIDAGGEPCLLAVEVDGALVGPDLLVEVAFAEVSRNPIAAVGILAALCRGKTALRHRLAKSPAFQPSALPYDPEALVVLREAARDGRAITLAAGTVDPFVREIARYLGGSAETQETANGAASALLIRRRTDASRPGAASETPARPGWRLWAKQLRLHQYAKNALVFLPLLTAHQFAVSSVLREFLAAIAFSLCASSVYLLNDLVDLHADRAHPSKRDRPLASGAIPLARGLAAAPALLVLGLGLAATVSPAFLAVVLGYFALTTAYSFSLKRKMIVDVVALAMLYTIRVIGGAVAIDVFVSEWLLAASMFIFMALALVKRYVELAARLDASLDNPSNRNYRIGDLDIVAMLAAASGFNTVTVLALWISSDTVRHLYRHPQVLWLICPVLMYWFGRLLMLAHRRMVKDDPIVFALKDRISFAAAAVILAILLAAI